MKFPSFSKNTSRLIDCKWVTCAETLAVMENFAPPSPSGCPPVSYGDAEFAADPGSVENQENIEMEVSRKNHSTCLLYVFCITLLLGNVWTMIHVFALTYVCVVYIITLCLQKDGVLTAEMVSSCLSSLEHSATGLKHTYHCLSLPVRHLHTYTEAFLKCITLTLQHVFIRVFAFKILGIVCFSVVE